ncbi:hypothetical protein OAX78_00125 [Planctomycetota bacterium]|nr:hypothetical protein [Planctomycetota bacterium]
MAGRIDRELKAQLVAKGQWQHFQRRRNELKAQGLSPNDARMVALGECTAEAPGEGSDCGEPVAASRPLPVAPAELAGRTAGAPEVARWVARNIDHPTPNPGDCPDPFAWTLLRKCRETPAFAHVFLRDVWVKLLAFEVKQEEAKKSDGEIDGQVTIDLIDRIKGMRDEAARETAMRNKAIRESVGACPSCGA